ncbi:concanavalin A-like lectin/glucanase [Panus rudis PR-1116 ss-1]|nr:concanavalin A-like lectin/glucanase [Panus rudis PR-1116 ss-1]
MSSSESDPLPRPRRPHDTASHRLSASSTTPFLGPGSPLSPFARPNMNSITSSSSLLSLDSPYVGAGRPLSLGEKYELAPDPQRWGAALSPDIKEADDELHEPDPREKRRVIERDGHFFSARGIANLGSLILFVLGLVTFFAGFPIIMYYSGGQLTNLGGFNLGGINGSGQVPVMAGHFALIDPDTPLDAYTKPSWASPNGKELELVFSDEFNVDGRTFYPGDDPYWEAVDLHYWPTNNLEWYDPAAITTQGGDLVITLSQKDTHNLDYQGGMMSTWNKFCFTGGYIEANVSLPGLNNVAGLWPAIWTMGNLGRAGYGATTEGTWPYTYDACDVGTVANQTLNGQPVAATINGDKGKGGVLSYLPGQKLSRCTCPNANDNSNGLLVHPGPKHKDGTFVGRAAPEIDVFEAQVGGEPLTGQVSQSAQWAPFNAGYIWKNTSDNEIIADPTISKQNSYIGSATQQATSVVTDTNQGCYEGTLGCYSIYGFEYKPGFDDAYITWISDNKVSWTLKVAGLDADPAVEISARPVPQEPMYIIVNLGMSHNFGDVDLDHIPFPVHLRVDYIRVYQDPDNKNIGCSPKDFPTEAYINQYIEAYTNPNLTTWREDFGQPFPGNSFLGQC